VKSNSHIKTKDSQIRSHECLRGDYPILTRPLVSAFPSKPLDSGIMQSPQLLHLNPDHILMHPRVIEISRKVPKRLLLLLRW
jgi:hypothetical protein